MTSRSGFQGAADGAADGPQTLLQAIHEGLYTDASTTLIDVGRDGATRSTPYADIWDRAHGVAEHLAGVGPVVGVFDDPADMVCALWAAIISDRPILMVQAHTLTGAQTHPEGKLQRAVELIDNPIVLSTRALGDRLREAVSTPAGPVAMDDLPLTAAIAPRIARPAGTSGAVQVRTAQRFELRAWTSGTTATPKIARISAPALMTRILASRRGGRDNVAINGFPFDGISGCSIAFPNGADVVYLRPDRFAEDPADLLRLVQTHRVASVGFSSSSAWRCLEALNGRRFDLSSLRRVGFGSERIMPAVVERLLKTLEHMGATDLICRFGYGMTEMGLICATGPYNAAKALEVLHRSQPHAIVGPPLQGLKLRIRQDDGSVAGPGDEGGIEVFGPGKMFSGYLGLAEADQPFTADGWLITGDRGRLCDNALQITGRSRQDIVVNGRNQSLAAIEVALRRLPGVDPIRLAALSVVPADGATEELAIILSPRPGTGQDGIAAEIRRATMRLFAVAARHVVCVPANAFPLTPSGKIDRTGLQALFAGQPRPSPRPDTTEQAPAFPDSALGDRIARLWVETLELDRKPRPHDDFHALGGDSFAAANVILAAEAIANRMLDVEAFFAEPTVATMVRLLGASGGAPVQDKDSGTETPGLLHSLARYVGSWTGDRALPDSLVIGSNVDGTRRPILWVLQSEHEMHALAKALGPDQPLYAMRSGVAIVKNYSTEVIDALVNRYLWEILSLPLAKPFVLGGNCQGGIVALALARRLRQLGQPLGKLILLEWSYSYGRYDAPTLLLYGEASPLSEDYTSESTRVTWREDFPEARPRPLPAAHGGFFSPDCVPHFARLLLAETEAMR